MVRKLKSGGKGRKYLVIMSILVITFIFYSLSSSGLLEGLKNESDKIGAVAGSSLQTGTPQKIGSVGVDSGKVEEVEIAVMGISTEHET